VLRGPGGKSTGDDLTLAIIGFKTNTITRRIDPPPHALHLFDAQAVDGHTMAEGPGPCPDAREYARRIVERAARVEVRIPITGPGWLDLIGRGSCVYGHLFVSTPNPDMEPTGWVSVADLLAIAGHGVAPSRTINGDQRAA